MPIESAVFHSNLWVVYWTAPGDAPSLPVPTASFTALVQAPSTTVLFDASGSSDTTGIIVQYQWDFGDGSPIVNQTIPTYTYTYTAPGNYAATLTITDDSGVTASVEHTVKVTANIPPVAKFTLSQSGLTVQVDGSTSSDADGHIVAYAWDFGDGATDTLIATSHSYAQGGTYNVTLVVTDDKGATGSATKTVNFQSLPVAGFTTTIPGGTGLTVNVDASSTVSQNPIATYAWAWGDNAITAASSNKTASHTYTAAGTYSITLTVKDAVGQTDTQTNLVTVSVPTPTNHPPTAAITTSISNRTVTASGAGSSDPDGDALTYAWTWGDGGTATGVAPAAHTYAADGTYTIGLTVTDTHSATGTATKSVTVSTTPTNNPPVAAFTSSASGQSVTFNASSSTDDGSITSYAWVFGDGTTGSGVAPTHTYANAGTFNVKLTVTDNGGLTNSLTKAITVSSSTPNQPPVASFTASASNLTVSFNGTASTDDVGVASWSWNFGDGTTGTGATTSHTYGSANTWTVTLTVTDGSGLTGSKSQSVTTSKPVTSGSVPNWDHIVLVMLENHSYAEISTTGYFKTIIGQGLNFTQMFATNHPSEPNYYALFAGSSEGISDDNIHWYTTDNLANQLIKSGQTFKGYSEGLPSVGYPGAPSPKDTVGAWARKHCPWISWQQDATFNPGGNVPPSVSVPFSQWQQSATFYAALPKFSYVIPNLNNDAHDGSLATAAQWCQTNLDGYAQWAKTHNSLLIIHTDEDDKSAGNNIYSCWVGDHITPGTTYSTKVNHYDALGVIQDACKLPRLLGSVGKPSITSPWVTSTPPPPPPPTTNWVLTWSDEFNGTSVDTSVWNVDNNTNFGSGNNELEVQLASNATVANSLLNITARKLTTPITVNGTAYNYSSAHLSSSGKKNFLIGPNNPLKIECYAKLPDVTHLDAGPVWLRPDDGGMGEVDLAEAAGTTDTDNAGNTRLSQTVHTLTYSPDVFSAAVVNLADPGGVTNWHLYSAEIYSDHTVFYVDNKQTAVINSSSAANGGGTLGSTYGQIFGTLRPWFMHITLAVGGNWPGTPTAATIFPAVMQYDYIRVYTTGGPGAAQGDAGGTGIVQSGTGIVNNSSLPTTNGTTFSQKIDTQSATTLVALNVGTYAFNDFADGTGSGGFWFGAKLTNKGILGAGSKYTIVQMTPNTSTKASYVPAQSTGSSNQLQYIYITTAGAKVDGVRIQGTAQGHLYNGLEFDGCASPTLSNSTIAGIPGNASSPPGETFGVNFHASTGTVAVTNVTVDGQGLTASAIGSNNSGATYQINNYLAINCPYSAGWASWEHTGVMNFGAANSPTKRFVMKNCARAFNAERLAGTVNFYDPLWDDPMSGHYDVNPTYETGWTGGTLNFYFTTAADWSAFTANRTNKKITAVSNSTSVTAGLVKGSVIKVYIAGVLQTQSNYVTWTGI